MHILHVTPYYVPAFAFGGVVRAVEGMARGLVQRGHTVTVLTTDALTRESRIAESEAIIDGVRVIRAANASLTLRGAANLSTPFAMRRIAPDLIYAVDIVHCHEFRTAENLIVTPVAARLHKPLVLSPHGTLRHDTGQSTLKIMWDRLISPRMARRFAGVIGLTDAETDDSRAAWSRFGAHHTRFVTLPNGVDADEFASLDAAAGESFRRAHAISNAPMVLFMARLHPRKGLDVLIDAFERLHHPSAVLMIAGADEGMLRRVRPRFSARVRYIGYLDAGERRAALAAADVFALPATGEGLPMGVLEALAAGVPVLISPDCHLPQVETFDAGMIAAPTADDVHAALAHLLHDSAARARMGENGRALVRAHFTWDQVAAQLESVYQHA